MNIITTWTDPISMKYHLDQFNLPKKSTIFFYNVIKKLINNRVKNILDLGCGAGAATIYFNTQLKNINFIGIDLDEKLIVLAKLMAQKIKKTNINFEKGDIYNLKKYKNINGVISLQVISFIDSPNIMLKNIFNRINPEWIVLSGLFYKGDISVKSIITEYKKKSRQVCYNTYSIPEINRFCVKNGYQVDKAIPFDIDIDLKKSDNIDILGTYTEKVLTKNKKAKRLQISGPILMNWHVIIIKRSKI